MGVSSPDGVVPAYMPLSRILGASGGDVGGVVGGGRGSLPLQRKLEDCEGSYFSTCLGGPEGAVAQISEAIRVDPQGHCG